MSSLLSLINVTKGEVGLSGAFGVAAAGFAGSATKFFAQEIMYLNNRWRGEEGQFSKESIENISSTAARYISVGAGILAFLGGIFMFTIQKYADSDRMTYQEIKMAEKAELLAQILHWFPQLTPPNEPDLLAYKFKFN